jgi:hypothetical protein
VLDLEGEVRHPGLVGAGGAGGHEVGAVADALFNLPDQVIEVGAFAAAPDQPLQGSVEVGRGAQPAVDDGGDVSDLTAGR